MKSLFFVGIIAFDLLHMSCKPKLVNAANLKNATASESKTENVVTKENNPYYSRTDTTVLHVSDADWKKVLSPDLYAVSREKDTERPFTGKYWDYTGKGTYYCAACGNRLFRSDL